MILDTDVLIALALPRCPERVARALAAATAPLYTTAVNWGEIHHGLARLPSPKAERMRQRYLTLARPRLLILSFDRHCAEVYGQIRSQLERRGERLDDPDLMIASIALRHDLTLVTGNTRHFSRIPGLRLENWLAED